jgi:DNA-directed RNA polymerase specialized sigma24 family protein
MYAPDPSRDDGCAAAFRAYYPRLVRLATKYTRDVDDAEDVVSEVFADLLFRDDRLAPVRIRKYRKYLSVAVTLKAQT